MRSLLAVFVVLLAPSAVLAQSVGDIARRGATADASLEADAGVDAEDDPGVIEIEAGTSGPIVPSGCSVGRGAPRPSFALLAPSALLWRRCA